MHDFIICQDNNDYKVSLENRKLYVIVPDLEAQKHGQIRIIDESGTEYLYPESIFLKIPLSKTIADQVAQLI